MEGQLRQVARHFYLYLRLFGVVVATEYLPNADNRGAFAPGNVVRSAIGHS